jgi:hypothetical protein
VSDHAAKIRAGLLNTSNAFVPGTMTQDAADALRALDALVARCAAAERFVEDVREWVAVAATQSDHPLLELLAEYDAGRSL